MTHILNSLPLLPLPPFPFHFPNRDQITNTTALLLKQAFSEFPISQYSIFHITLHITLHLHLHLHLKRSKQSAGANLMKCGLRCPRVPRVGFRRSVSSPSAPTSSPALQLSSATAVLVWGRRQHMPCGHCMHSLYASCAPLLLLQTRQCKKFYSYLLACTLLLQFLQMIVIYLYFIKNNSIVYCY